MKKRGRDIMVNSNREWAEGIIKFINESKNPNIRYKTSRPVTSIKDMITSSADIFADNIVFRYKGKNDDFYKGITYSKMYSMVNALGTKMIDMGLKGKRISVIGENSYRWSITYLATVCGVGVVVPLDKELGKEELANIIKRADVSAVFFDSKYKEIFKEIKKEIKGLDILVEMAEDVDDKDVLSIDQLVSEGEKLVESGNKDFIDAEINPEEMSIILFTSGTTGNSKGVMLSHKNICFQLMVAPTFIDVVPEDVFFSILPIHHTYECTCGFLMPIYKGASIAYCQGLKYIVKNLQEVKPTMFLGVPAIFEALYKKIWKEISKSGKEKTMKIMMGLNSGLRKVSINISRIYAKKISDLFGGNIKTFICGGAKIDPAILDFFQNCNINSVQGYGLTEASPMAALNTDFKPNSSSIGAAVPLSEVEIWDKDPETGIGEIVVKGDHIMLGYYDNPEATAEALVDGWYKTGDLGYMDKKGYIYMTGRKKSVIITKNGKNVSPEEIEYLINQVPFVCESMVWGADDGKGGDTTIHATIRIFDEDVKEILGDDFKDDDVVSLLWDEVDKINEKLPLYKKVKKITYRKEDFEKTTAQKIKRFVESNRV